MGPGAGSGSATGIGTRAEQGVGAQEGTGGEDGAGDGAGSGVMMDMPWSSSLSVVFLTRPLGKSCAFTRTNRISHPGTPHGVVRTLHRVENSGHMGSFSLYACEVSAVHLCIIARCGFRNNCWTGWHSNAVVRRSARPDEAVALDSDGVLGMSRGGRGRGATTTRSGHLATQARRGQHQLTGVDEDVRPYIVVCIWLMS